MTLSTHKGALHYGPTNFTSLTGAGTWELEIIRHHGNPNPLYIGTTLVERSITTIRQQLWRFTPITYGYTKKLLTLRAAFALYVANYNFARIHGSLRVTPAMARGVPRGYGSWSGCRPSRACTQLTVFVASNLRNGHRGRSWR